MICTWEDIKHNALKKYFKRFYSIIVTWEMNCNISKKDK